MKPVLLRVTFVTALVTSAWAPIAARQAQAPAPSGASRAFSPQDTIPFDAAVKTGTLPNGLTYYVRKNSRPANRVLLRLAVKTGSLDEADDQQGLAHMLEHMAFNGSAHFPPGQLVSYFESTGARLGPHVNAYTSFEETVYMLDLPSDKPEIVEKGMTAFADFAGGLTLDPKEIDKERGVVIEEWRGGLGAQSRVRDKQIPILFYHSRFADRLPIGKPDIIRTFAPARLRAFYDTFYRPDRMALVAVGDMDVQKLEDGIKAAFGGLQARTPAPPPRRVDVPLHKETLVSVVTDPEITQSSVTLLRKRSRAPENTVGDYRRDLVQRLFEQMLNERFDEITRRADAKFLRAGVYGDGLSSDVETESLSASVQDGRIPEGLAAVALEAKRAREFGFGAAELDRAKKWMAAYYERAYTERDKTESGSFAQEYLNYFLEHEPTPGIEYEYRLVQQFLPGITAQETAALGKTLLAEDARVILATSPQKPGVKVPTEDELKTTIANVEAAAVTPWNDTTTTREIVERKPEPAAIVSTRTVDAVGLTIVTFANGVEAWLKPTDFKNDQVVFAMQAKGGTSLAAPEDFFEASFATSYVSISGAAGLKALDLQKLLAGKLANASPFASLSTHGFSGSAAPAQLETALQLLYARFTQPGDDPEAFELMKRQLSAAVANRLDSPQTLFSDKLEQVNTSNHYTSKPLTAERVAALDRAKMIKFYRDRFSNAADFTFFMVGAFKSDEALPLLARYIGGLPSTGKPASDFKDVGIAFPGVSDRAKVEKGREPKSETVLSYYAEPPANDPMEQERALAATDVLEIALRDILREELGQTYTVSVDLSQYAPQRGGGHIEINFGAAPENIEKMTARVMQEVERFKKEGPSEDLLNKAKETARRNYETQLKTNGYWLGRFEAVKLWGQDPAIIARRLERINALTVDSVKDAFTKYFPPDRTTIVTLVPQ
ncbi:MAG TPA: insulinase family protein [Vicinamibacterales bacterium]|nr:insulinase family protein [Vicinamibacterales bacterium]